MILLEWSFQNSSRPTGPKEPTRGVTRIAVTQCLAQVNHESGKKEYAFDSSRRKQIVKQGQMPCSRPVLPSYPHQEKLAW
jgi:hypothetical protein